MSFINAHDRAGAAALLLDAAATLSLADYGTEEADDRLVLALGSIGIELEGSPEFKPVVAATIDLLTFLALREGQRGGVPVQAVLQNMKRHVLPLIYPDVLGGGQGT